MELYTSMELEFLPAPRCTWYFNTHIEEVKIQLLSLSKYQYTMVSNSNRPIWAEFTPDVQIKYLSPLQARKEVQLHNRSQLSALFWPQEPAPWRIYKLLFWNFKIAGFLHSRSAISMCYHVLPRASSPSKTVISCHNRPVIESRHTSCQIFWWAETS